WFYPDSRERDSLRLSFSTLSEATITEGTRRLGCAVMEGLAERGAPPHSPGATSPPRIPSRRCATLTAPAAHVPGATSPAGPDQRPTP
ncbi:MAG: hypothetical protein M3Q03_17940, partial [Chloroflexota bacterium]|nr:hypothetical protein [Chloroflexota bacterium]